MENNALPKKILLIDDDMAVAEAVTTFLKKHNVQVVRAGDLDTALYHFNQQIFEVVVVELEFAPLPGLALVQKLRQTGSAERRQAGIVITSGQQRKGGDDGLAQELGDMELVNKPLTDIKLLPALLRAVQRKRALIEYEQTREVCYDHMKAGKVQEAIDKAKASLPKLQRKGMSLMCQLYEDAGKFAEALQIVDSILAKKSDDIAMLNAKGRLLLKSGDAAKAREFLEKADKLAPQNLERIREMAQMYLQLEEPDHAKGKMKELISLNPEQSDLKFDLFRDLENAGFIEHAIGLCKETTLPAEVVRYYNNKGVMLSKSGENKQALKEYTSAIRFYPTFKDNFRIFFNIAIAEANQKSAESLQRAEAALQKCLELHPEFEKAGTLLAQVQRALLQAKKRAS